MNDRRKGKPLPSQLIRESLRLDLSSKTGLRWNIRPRDHFETDMGWKITNGRCGNREAGSRQDGRMGKFYWSLEINGVGYMCHRIVYFLTFGRDPVGFEIDHIDGDGLNNFPSNLRLATVSKNGMNRGPQRNNTSGRKGVSWHKKAGKWGASIRVGGKPRHLGLFEDINDASAAYEAAAREHFGEFYREGRTDALAQH